MSPHKQPPMLFRLCVDKFNSLINIACHNIEMKYPMENMYHYREQEALELKELFVSMLPVSLFDVLCEERKWCTYRGDHRIYIQIVTHPRMKTFRKCHLDISIPEQFWIDNLCNFSSLVVLNLNSICTDEILQVVGQKCPLLEEISIVSRVDTCQSQDHGPILIRNVSDLGLFYIRNLKRLRTLGLDSLGDESSIREGRHISAHGVIYLISQLPLLEELIMQFDDIGNILIGTNAGPLSLKSVYLQSATADDIKKIIRVCPFLENLSMIPLQEHDQDEILKEITRSNLRLNKLSLESFSHSHAMQHLLQIKGSNITHLSLTEADYVLTLNLILEIGLGCPNLEALTIHTRPHTQLHIPQSFQPPRRIFSELRKLTLINRIFSADDLLLFLCGCTEKLQKIKLEESSTENIDDIFVQLLNNGCLKNIDTIWLDDSFKVSESLLIEIIKKCDKLYTLAANKIDETKNVYKYILDNNLDVSLGGC